MTETGHRTDDDRELKIFQTLYNLVRIAVVLLLIACIMWLLCPLCCYKSDEPFYKAAKVIFSVVLAAVILSAIACCCWVHECGCFRGSSPSIFQTCPENCQPEEAIAQLPPVDQVESFDIEDGEKSVETCVVKMPVICRIAHLEEVQTHERRPLDSVFEPDPHIPPADTATPVASAHCKPPAFSSAPISLPLAKSVSSSPQEQSTPDFTQAPLPSEISPDLLPQDSQNHEPSEFPLSQNHSFNRLPTIPEHPPITSNTSRTLSNEVIPNPTSLPDFTTPSTSSMPNLAPSTSITTCFPPRDVSRLLFYRNTNIDVCDIQNSNLELEASNGNLTSIDSNDSLTSVEPPGGRLVIVDFHNLDDPAKKFSNQ